jgi:hypothetical protein
MSIERELEREAKQIAARFERQAATVLRERRKLIDEAVQVETERDVAHLAPQRFQD